ncbi:hypothetical protein [Bacillus cereus]|uniref:hypothetical protein n=1 Tax=Bacillus cereus TaxID=1396 RepID=UPI002ABF7A28|nr:hypothetical protein [Bacillus cereus]MDZ4422641.1 hypothetical protein [Bacillus cereus]
MCPDNNLDNKLGEYKGYELRDNSTENRSEYSVNKSSDRSLTVDVGKESRDNDRDRTDSRSRDNTSGFLGGSFRF